MQGKKARQTRRPARRTLLSVRGTIKHSYRPYQTGHAQEIVSSWSLKVIQGPIAHKVVTLKKVLNNLKWGSEQALELLSHMTWKPKWQSACRDDQPVLLLGEDGDPRGLEDSDLHQSAVGLHRFAVVKGDDKQLRHRREEADEANEAETNVKP